MEAISSGIEKKRFSAHGIEAHGTGSLKANLDN
jgi:hypothetical protein